MTPPLTTIHQPKDELGELAIGCRSPDGAARLATTATSATPVLTVRGRFIYVLNQIVAVLALSSINISATR